MVYLALEKENRALLLHDQGIIAKNVKGHCLSGQGGFLFLGDDLYDSSRIAWTRMSPDHTTTLPGSAELHFGGKITGFKNLNIVFDNGSSYTYFNSWIYHSLITFINEDLLSGKPVKEATEDRTLPLCWKGKRPFKSTRDVRKYSLIFPSGNASLGILNGTDVGLNSFNMIGECIRVQIQDNPTSTGADISMQDKLLVYDNEKHLIGWTPANCNQLSRSSTL
ncbi:eukaryotic aspartyl protease family protein [Striga asiatica]|uniref:Eukaryotic aspartyl protease family protein n=1 Tax=Striga asiatica TaxID=4170 RepID=A0A5A7PRE0_STRAF|nr:eukaryotic aspartyl protease family protein [Striga asiatica]